MRDRLLLPLFIALLVSAPIAWATPPGGIDVTCDVSRVEFRLATQGQTDVKFKLWSASSGGSQLGSDYSVAMANLAVAKRYTEKYDSVTKRKAARINAAIRYSFKPRRRPRNYSRS